MPSQFVNTGLDFIGFGVRRKEGKKVGETLSEKTPIQIGFLVTCILAVAGVAASSIWWASQIQSKLDTLIDEVKSSRVIQSKVSDLEMKSKILEMRLLQLETTPGKH